MLTFCLCAALAAWGLGCAPEPPPNPKAREFAQHVKSDIIYVNQRLAAKVARQDKKAIHQELERMYADALDWGNPLAYGIALLNIRGFFFAGRYPTRGYPEGVKDQDTAQNYSNYELVREALDRGQTRQGVFYTQAGPIYLICSPLVWQGKVAGAVIMGFSQEFISHTIGLSRQEFMALDFSPQ